MRQDQFTDFLISNFDMFIEAYINHCPFTKYGQLEHHVDTIRLRKELGSVQVAINNNQFLRSLYETLLAWGIGSRASKLKVFNEFTEALQKKYAMITEFEHFKIGSVTHVSEKAKKLVKLIQTLDIVDNDSRIVSGTKTLHHLLPDLVVPIDRKYTQYFFGWNNSQFQNFPQECFIQAFKSFERIARAKDLSQYINEGWFSSKTKVIDNAIVGFSRWIEFDASTMLNRINTDSNSLTAVQGHTSPTGQ